MLSWLHFASGMELEGQTCRDRGFLARRQKKECGYFNFAQLSMITKMTICSILIEIKESAFSEKGKKKDFNPGRSASLFERHSIKTTVWGWSRLERRPSSLSLGSTAEYRRNCVSPTLETYGSDYSWNGQSPDPRLNLLTY